MIWVWVWGAKLYPSARERGYDRFGLGALEYANDCYKAAEKEKRARLVCSLEKA